MICLHLWQKTEMPEKQYFITVLLPFFKVGCEFDRAIESIVNQSFRSWKLMLISNNGSPEGIDIAEKWIKKDNRIKLLREPEQGIAYALNTGLRHCNTPYIARMDADDVSHPQRFDKQYAYLETNPDVDVVASQTVFSTDITGSHGFSIFVNWQNSIIAPEHHDLYRFIESPLAHPSVMFRSGLIENYGSYTTRPVPEDYEMWLRWMDRGVRIYKLPEPLLTWNDHTDRLTRTHENYSREAFYQIKCEYLAKWISRNVSADKKIIVCGSSRIGRKRAAMLQGYGVNVFGFTDVKKRPNRQVNFIQINEITAPDPWFLINFIARRGVGQAIRQHFSAIGFVEGRDFILSA